MYLEKLEIQGFKSFANKNVLIFPGMLDKSRRGLTAIVGPNGSGKSNVADAVRWALVEQSMKTLRGKKAEDIIFSGSDKKGKLGMAEVSLFLNNEDGRAPIDYSEIVITRRLYRSGESEYLLNNSRVRLFDIQMLLAKAKFGQKTYSVIGQGMVEGFLNTSLAERKEFFDEATGVKQYQIKRDDSLNKLRASYENLIQAQMLINEIDPRLKSLTRQVNRLHKRGEIEKELQELQTKYYRCIWHEINDKFKEYNEQFLEMEKGKFKKDKKLKNLNRELEALETASVSDGGNGFIALQDKLSREQEKKEELNKKLSKFEAQLEIKLEANGKFDLSYLLNKKEEIAKQISAIKEEIKAYKRNIDFDKQKDEELIKEKEEIDNETRKLNAKFIEFGKNVEANGEKQDAKQIKKKLEIILNKLRSSKAESEIEVMRGLLDEAVLEIENILSLVDGETQDKTETTDKNSEWQVIHEGISKLTDKKENVISRINDNNLRVSARSERVKLLEEKEKGLASEMNAIESKLKQQSKSFDYEEFNKEQDGLRKEISASENTISLIKEKIGDATAEEEKKKSNLFSLQRDLQSLQNEINEVNNKLNEIKINSTRYETKLEDLEIEIREELKSLQEIKKGGEGELIEPIAAKEKISSLKRQLELIGGIDPQVEKEYTETKERFDFLNGQVNDLNSAIGSLEKIIEELDTTIKEQFDKEFKLIAKKFEEYFKALFNGGNARIIKVIEEEKTEEEAEEDGKEAKIKAEPQIADLKKIKFLQKHNATGLAGIEIQATPPGKKIKTTAMLSGGERALTAIALICAIISSNPAPFVVLDEVDAALDEANSERLAKILDELAHKTQFIVITHNRASMRKANILYGVTMGDDSVSKLLSIKLDDAKGMTK
ncbi:AAA family ATPase [bacterium]|nr:AAA family ATPase [bacterium]